jgi:hypothetical protein
VKTSAAFVPPNPNEFVNTALISMVLGAERGEKWSSKMASGCSKFNVGGATP